MSSKKKHPYRKKIILGGIAALAIGVVAFFVMEGKITLGPVMEHEKMIQLEKAKLHYKIAPFVTDGCSGNISSAWSLAVEKLADTVPGIEVKYEDAKNIPFEYACEAHDRLYYRGEGGYVGRLIADNALRQQILTYAIQNTEDIKKRTGIQTDESAIFLYETIAELVYRGVRLGGGPCSGEPYAWGYGYNGGSCE